MMLAVLLCSTSHDFYATLRRPTRSHRCRPTVLLFRLTEQLSLVCLRAPCCIAIGQVRPIQRRLPNRSNDLARQLLCIRSGPLVTTTQLGREAIKVAIHRVIAAIFCIILSFSVTERQVAAQNSPTPRSFSTTPKWQAADEITFGGAIADVVSKSPAGSPVGLNLLMTGTRSDLYVNLGPNLHSNVRQSLSSGQSIQVTGIVRSLGGQNYLLARQLVIGNQTIDIRTSNGALIHTLPPGTAASTKTRRGTIGGAQ